MIVLENSNLMRINAPWRNKSTIQHNKETNDLHASLNIIRVTKAKKMCWTRCVVCTTHTHTHTYTHTHTHMIYERGIEISNRKT